MSNDGELLIQSNRCNRISVWTTLCAVDSRGSPTKSDPFSCISYKIAGQVKYKEMKGVSNNDKVMQNWIETIRKRKNDSSMT